MSKLHKNINGPRRDLTDIEHAAALVELVVSGPGIESLAGLEAMSSLQSLELVDLESPDLSALASLPALTKLQIFDVSGPVDYSPLERVQRLERLVVTPTDAADATDSAGAASLARVDFGQLRRLRVLSLGGSLHPDVAVDLGWLEHLPELEQLDVWGFLLDIDALIQMAVPPRLEWVQLGLTSWDELDRLQAAFPGVTIQGQPHDYDPSAPEEAEEDTGPRMDIDEFWSLMESSRATPEDGHDAQARALEALLRERSADDLAAFERQYRDQLRRAARWELWGAGYLIGGGMGDDSFDYFCDFLIGCGRQIFELAVADPDALVDVPEVMHGRLENELLRYAVYEAYEREQGDKLPISQSAGRMTGEGWDEDGDDLAKLLPRLWASEGWEED